MKVEVFAAHIQILKRAAIASFRKYEIWYFCARNGLSIGLLSCLLKPRILGFSADDKVLTTTAHGEIEMENLDVCV